MVPKVKICGVTRPADALAVAHAGADAIGLNFAPVSPRRVETRLASELTALVAGALTRVGVFVDATAAEIEQVLQQVDLDALQFSGGESGAFCGQFGKPYLKVVHVRAPLDMAALEAEYAGACGLLLDTYLPGRFGGTGQRFDWSLWPGDSRLPLGLAGGLAPGNVAEAVRRLKPWVVDVAGGVEGAVKGEKSAERIVQFVDEVRRAGD